MARKKSRQPSTPGNSDTAEAESVETVNTFQEALAGAAPRPNPLATGREKKNYSERLSNKIAVLVANKVRATGLLEGEILPSPGGKGREKKIPSGAFNKPKKTDVGYSTLSGLELLISIKTLGFKDVKKGRLGRYTKNMVRNDHELRAEAMEFHERYPYAVLVALFFIPRDACDDGETTDKSSFAHAVMTFRARAGRHRPDEPAQLFERFYIGLYDYEGPNAGRVEFFNVLDMPRRKGPPSKLVGLDEVVREALAFYGERNRIYIRFEDDEPERKGAPPKLSPQAEAPNASDADEGVDDDGDEDGEDED
jgi:hypothetical protein